MKLEKFTAPTARQALAKAKLVFGDATLILSNRLKDGEVEVIAAAEPGMAQIDQAVPVDQVLVQPPVSLHKLTGLNPLQQDLTQLAMSTLSFQDYVRERRVRKSNETLSAQVNKVEPASPGPLASMDLSGCDATKLFTQEALSVRPVRQTRRSDDLASSELQAIKTWIAESFEHFNWQGQLQHNPRLSCWMLKLIRAGYSAPLARTVLECLPEQGRTEELENWVRSELERQLKTATFPTALGTGRYALIGASGVGKTSVALKIAKQTLDVEGANCVGLISLDSGKSGAQDFLRSQARSLGLSVHLAHDRATLQDLLGLLESKKKVIIDLPGVGAQDQRTQDLLETIDLPDIRRVLVLNAGAHGDTLDQMVGRCKSATDQLTVLTKLDEAVKLGPVLDVCMRHQLLLCGLSCSDLWASLWESAHAGQLLKRSLDASDRVEHAPGLQDLSFFVRPSSVAQIL